ncbi:MAG TPA: hypothetical protein VF345_03625 [Chthoniobacterales bacterium]
MTGGTGPLGNEIDWTPVVANQAVAILKAAGVNAIKDDASIKHSDRNYQCKLAVFLHFDDPDSGESGPSVGYDHNSDADAAGKWKALYREFFPFDQTWRTDNFTEDEHYYYGFSHTFTSDAEFLIEFGDLNSRRQAEWMKPRLRWMGSLLAHFLSKRSGFGDVPKPAPFEGGESSQEEAATVPEQMVPPIIFLQGSGDDPLNPGPGAQPVGHAEPFRTSSSNSGDENGSSKTDGLIGTAQAFDDGTIVIDATERLRAVRTDGLNGTLTGHWRRVQKGNTFAVRQENYSYRGRKLPDGALFLDAVGIPNAVPAEFIATAVKTVKATQFGKGDKQDEGTGSPTMGTVQTNSDVVGGSVKISIMEAVFGKEWSSNDKRLNALIEVYFKKTRKMVRVPLVDVGPGEHAPSHAEVDLTLACDQFLGTDGLGVVDYRLLVPKDASA